MNKIKYNNMNIKRTFYIIFEYIVVSVVLVSILFLCFYSYGNGELITLVPASIINGCVFSIISLFILKKVKHKICIIDILFFIWGITLIPIAYVAWMEAIYEITDSPFYGLMTRTMVLMMLYIPISIVEFVVVMLVFFYVKKKTSRPN